MAAEISKSVTKQVAVAVEYTYGEVEVLILTFKLEFC